MAGYGDKLTADDSPNMNDIRTVGQLRAALAGIADETPLIVLAVDTNDDYFCDEQVISSVGFGLIDWHDGRGMVSDTILKLECDQISWAGLEEMRNRPSLRRLEAGQDVAR